MQLRTWIELVGETESSVAKAIGLRQSTVHRHMTGARAPTMETIEAYRRLTKGAVTEADWRDLHVNGPVEWTKPRRGKRRSSFAPAMQSEVA